MFVKKCYRLRSIIKEYTSYGERVAWHVGNMQFNFIYRLPGYDLQPLSELFADSLCSNDRIIYFGDFNL